MQSGGSLEGRKIGNRNQNNDHTKTNISETTARNHASNVVVTVIVRTIALLPRSTRFNRMHGWNGLQHIGQDVSDG